MSETQLTAQIVALRRSLASADIAVSGSLAKVFESFLDLVEGSDLMTSCKAAEEASIHATLEHLLRRVTDDEAVSVGALQMLTHAPTGLFHGGFFAAGTMGTFFYFLPERLGLLALRGAPPATHFFRMSATELPPGTVLVPRPPGVQ